MKKINYLLLLPILLTSSCSFDLSSILPFYKESPLETEYESEKESSLVSIEESESIKESEKESESIKESDTSLSEYDDIFSFNNITVGLNDSYNLQILMNEDYINEIVDLYVNDKTIAKADASNSINGLKVGKTYVDVMVNDEFAKKINIEVVDNMLDMKFDIGRLYGKNITVFGDSISDSSIKAEVLVNTYWPERIQNLIGEGKVYNYAKSGATVGYNKSMERAGALSIVGTTMVQSKACKQDIQASDYVIIYYGNNDFWREVTTGVAGDTTDANYESKESFIGSYTYLINKIKEYNPNIHFILMSVTYSTWGLENVNKDTHAMTRIEMNEQIKQIAIDNNCTYIDLYDLWDFSNKNTDVIARDGIHPNDHGHQLIVDRIMGNI